MGRQFLERPVPMRVDRIIDFEGSSRCGDEGVIRFAGGHLHRVVDHADPDALVAEVIDLAQVPVGRVIRPAVGLDDEGVGILERARIGRPAVEIGRDEHLVSVVRVEQLLREERSGVVLVHAAGWLGRPAT